jgi:hypothetical protein
LRDTSGVIGEWLMGKDGSITTTALLALPDLSMVTTGDINGDGIDDILWQSPSGRLAAWFMNDGQIAGTADYGLDPALAKLAGGDFNHDSSAGADLLSRTSPDAMVNLWDVHATPTALDFLVQ